MADANTIYYDDTSNQIHHPSGPWYPLIRNYSDVYNETISGVNDVAVFTFTFFGSRVYVYGGLRGMNYTLSEPTESTYSIDNVVKQNYIAPQVKVDDYGVMFFDSGDIGALNHFMLVNITSATASFPYYLDSIAVVSPLNASTTSSQSLTPSHSVTPVPSGQHPAAGPIAGGVLGGVSLISLLAAIFFWYRRRKSRSLRERVNIHEDKFNPNNIEGAGIGQMVPFILPQRYGVSLNPTKSGNPPLTQIQNNSSSPQSPGSSRSSSAPALPYVYDSKAYWVPSTEHVIADRQSGSSTDIARSGGTQSSLPVPPHLVGIASNLGLGLSGDTEGNEGIAQIAELPPAYTPV